MTHDHGSRPRRLPALFLIVALLVLAGIADATVRPRRASPFRHPARAQSSVLTSSTASSSAWYCPGPLPLGSAKGVSSIAVANLGRRSVSGRLLVASSAGGTTSQAVAVAPHAQAVYGLTRRGAAAKGAVTVLVDSSSVGVEELVHGPTGPLSAPCVDRAGTTEHVAPGSTRGADNVSLAIYDPGATPSVVSVSFATTTGPAAPPSFQGIPVGAGGLVVLDVGHEVSSRIEVATTVRATGGRVVVGAFIQAIEGHVLLGSLLSATGAGAHRWAFSAAPLGGVAHQSFSILNPSTSAAHVVLHLDSTAGVGELTALVPPGAVESLTPAASSTVLSVSAATLVSSGAPVVIGREIFLGAATATRPVYRRVRRETSVVVAVHGRKVRRRELVLETVLVGSPLTTLPGLPAGFSASAGVTGFSRRWLLGGGESDRRTSEVVVVSNPGPTAAVVALAELGGSAPGRAGESHLATVRVPPDGSVSVSLRTFPAAEGDLPVVVTSSEPIVAGDLLYAEGPRPVGFAAVPGIPVR